jgi:hypothetical protein
MSSGEVSIGHKSIAARQEVKQLEFVYESLKTIDNDDTFIPATPLVGC